MGTGPWPHAGVGSPLSPPRPQPTPPSPPPSQETPAGGGGGLGWNEDGSASPAAQRRGRGSLPRCVPTAAVRGGAAGPGCPRGVSVCGAWAELSAWLRSGIPGRECRCERGTGRLRSGVGAGGVTPKGAGCAGGAGRAGGPGAGGGRGGGAEFWGLRSGVGNAAFLPSARCGARGGGSAGRGAVRAERGFVGAKGADRTVRGGGARTEGPSGARRGDVGGGERRETPAPKSRPQTAPEPPAVPEAGGSGRPGPGCPHPAVTHAALCPLRPPCLLCGAGRRRVPFRSGRGFRFSLGERRLVFGFGPPPRSRAVGCGRAARSRRCWFRYRCRTQPGAPRRTAGMRDAPGSPVTVLRSAQGPRWGVAGDTRETRWGRPGDSHRGPPWEPTGGRPGPP